ncbi:MAG: hypothetical protein ABMA14_23485 [Hyphomonadaceae bacterium]
MIRWLKSPLPLAALAATVVLAFLFLGPLDFGLKYLHFSTLTKDRLVREAEVYARERAGGPHLACLYAVRCNSTAYLELVSDVAAWDLDATKQTIWARRFSTDCPGRTANFALHVIPARDQEAEIDAGAYARWSFFDDQFVPLRGRFESGAFTDQTWEPCTKEKAIISSRY